MFQPLRAAIPAGNDAGRGPDVRHQVLAAGLQSHRVVRPTCVQKNARNGKVDQRRQRRDHQPNTRLLQRQGVDQAVESGGHDHAARHQDQQALKSAGKIFRLAVTIRVAGVRRQRGDAQHEQRHHGAAQIDKGFQRVGQQAHRAGQHPGQ